MSIEQFWSNTVIEQQKRKHYMNVQTDPLDNPLTTRSIWIGWELSIKQYLKSHFGLIDNLDRVFGDGSVLTLTWTRSGSTEPLLLLHMTKQLDCTISIDSTQNNGIHGILFRQHTTFNRLNHFAYKWKRESITIWGVDWTTWKSNHFNLKMLGERSSLKSILGSAMIVGLKIIHISSERYTIGIFSNVFSYFWHISYFRPTSIMKWCASQTGKVTKYSAIWRPATSGSIRKIGFLPEQQLCQSFVHPTRLTWPIFLGTRMPGRCVSWLVIFEKISAGHLKGMPGFSLGWIHVPQKVPKLPMRRGIQPLEQWCPHFGILI